MTDVVRDGVIGADSLAISVRSSSILGSVFAGSCLDLVLLDEPQAPILVNELRLGKVFLSLRAFGACVSLIATHVALHLSNYRAHEFSVPLCLQYLHTGGLPSTGFKFSTPFFDEMDLDRGA